MEFEEWKPFYDEIVHDFGYTGDEESARLLSTLLPPAEDARTSFVLYRLSDMFYGNVVVICGNAPCLKDELLLFLSVASPRKSYHDYLIMAADGATSVLLDLDVVPDVIVTDLDGDMDAIVLACNKGSIAVVHAHGDNMDKLREYVPLLPHVIGTTQAAPLDNVFNFGGFTDGDRCAFLAAHFNPSKIRLVGFDFDDPTVTPRKAKKLAWAKRLITLAIYGDDPGPRQ